MRTTLEIEDSVLAAARSLARDEGMSLGTAVSLLARRGLAPTAPVERGGFPIFDVSHDLAPVIPSSWCSRRRWEQFW